jgi:molecular chaperone GrpE
LSEENKDKKNSHEDHEVKTSIYERLNPMSPKKRSNDSKKEKEKEKAELQKLKDELDKKNAELDKKNTEYEALSNKLMRLIAEFDNFRKRSERERIALYDNSIEDVVKKILPVLDNLERALETKPETSSESKFFEGFDMVARQLEEAIAGFDVSVIEVNTGDDFDPNLHDAIAHTGDENLGTNQISKQVGKGYKHKDKVIRHSKVVVAN